MKLMSYQVYIRNDYDEPFNERGVLVFKERCWNSCQGYYYREYYILKHEGTCIKTGTKAELRRWLKHKQFFEDPFDSGRFYVWKKDWRKIFVGMTYKEVNYPPTRWLYRAE